MSEQIKWTCEDCEADNAICECGTMTKLLVQRNKLQTAGFDMLYIMRTNGLHAACDVFEKREYVQDALRDGKSK